MSNRDLRPAMQTPLARDIERTFGFRPRWPRAGRRLVLGLALGAVLTTGAAAAAWQVRDDNARQELREVRNRIGGSSSATVVGELQKINTRMRIDHRSSSDTRALLEAPTGDGRLDAARPSASQASIQNLCPSRAITNLGQQQRLLCQERVRTELAQYTFSMQMFERAAEHHEKLKEIEQRRRNLGADDYADVQYNTNELLALSALMDNDRDRYQTYMRAYEARIAHIRHAQAGLTRNAFKGRSSVSLPISL